MLNEFKDFISRGSVIDMAVGIIIGAAFTAIVKSAVADVIMPPIGLLTGRRRFQQHLHQPVRWRVRLAGGGPRGRRGDDQCRCLHQRGDQLPDRRGSHLPTDQAGQPPEEGRRGGARGTAAAAALGHPSGGDPRPAEEGLTACPRGRRQREEGPPAGGPFSTPGSSGSRPVRRPPPGRLGWRCRPARHARWRRSCAGCGA